MRFQQSFVIPIRFVFIIWAAFVLDLIIPYDLARLGILPRTLSGLTGVVFAPMIHGSLFHLLANTFPVLFLGSVLFLFYDQIARQVFFQCYFVTNMLVWIFGRSSLHIGASGLLYGIAAFLISIGLFRKDFKSILISTIILILYGGLIYGVFPSQPGVSWESHLLGALVGIGTASQLARVKKVSTE